MGRRVAEVAGAPAAAAAAASTSGAPPGRGRQPAPGASDNYLADTSQPCSIAGATSALFAGGLGYFFGFVPAAFKHRGAAWRAVHADGVRSAQTFAIMSGLYTAVHCIAQRLRRTEDGYNRLAAGCSTGLVLGWPGGPLSSAQSCIGIGALSYFLDFGGSAPAAHAATAQRPAAAAGPRRERRPAWRLAPPAALAALPPVAWLGAVAGQSCFFGCSAGVGDAALAAVGAALRR